MGTLSWMVPVGCTLGYIVISLIFFYFPNLLHRKKTTAFKVRHISHRGGASESIENTIAAFRHCLQAGSEFLEMDVRLTRDGKVVVHHDSSCVRLTGEGRHVRDFNFDELPQLNQHVDWTTFSGEPVVHTRTDEKIVLLSEVFETFPDVPLSIDVKDGTQEAVDAVEKLVKQFGREHLTVWGGFGGVNKLCWKTNKNIVLMVSVPRAFMFYVLHWLFLIPFIPMRESVWMLPMLETFMKMDKFKEANCFIRGLVKAINWLYVSPRLWAHLQRRGIHVYLWVLNSDDEFALAEKRGVSGILTDHPTRLANWYAKRDGGAQAVTVTV